MKYEKRLRSLARQKGLCPVHLTPLVCNVCDWQWTGTVDEWGELSHLLSRLDDTLARVPAQGRCHVGHDLHCEPCWQHGARQALLAVPGDELYTVEEMERCMELLTRLQRKDTPNRSHNALRETPAGLGSPARRARTPGV
jgi:hypothetical protein